MAHRGRWGKGTGRSSVARFDPGPDRSRAERPRGPSRRAAQGQSTNSTFVLLTNKLIILSGAAVLVEDSTQPLNGTIMATDLLTSRPARHSRIREVGPLWAEERVIILATQRCDGECACAWDGREQHVPTGMGELCASPGLTSNCGLASGSAAASQSKPRPCQPSRSLSSESHCASAPCRRSSWLRQRRLPPSCAANPWRSNCRRRVGKRYEALLPVVVVRFLSVFLRRAINHDLS